MNTLQDSIEQQRRQLIDDIQTLPADLLQTVADMLSELRESAKKSEAEPSSKQLTSSPYEAFKESGFIGCGEGPSDLAANHKKYLEEGWNEKYGDR